MYYRKPKMGCPVEVTKPSIEKSILYYQILRTGDRSLSPYNHTPDVENHQQQLSAHSLICCHTGPPTLKIKEFFI